LSFENFPNSLKYLYVRGAKLTSFSFIDNLQNLQILYICDNKLTTFSFKNCPSCLTQLSLTDNQLNSFSYENCPNSLQKLYLYNNPITNISINGNHPVNCKIIGLGLIVDYTKCVKCSEECIICFNDDNTVQLPCFSTHVVHIDCLKEWFNSCEYLLKGKCPLCNKWVHWQI